MTAFYDTRSERAYSYDELRAEVEKAAERLRYPRKALVFCFPTNDIHSVIGYLAALEAGHAVALLDPALDDSFKERLIGFYGPDFLLSVGPPGELTIRRTDKPREREIHPDLAVLLSTSGSTGSAKLVRLSKENIRSNACAIREALSICSEDRPVSSLPLYYSYGLSVINSHLVAGATVVLTDEKLISPRFWEIVRSQQCTSFAGVPYAYQVLDRLNLERLDVPSLTSLTQAGGALNVELVAKFHRVMEKRGGRLFVMYGQTEATARIAVLPPECLAAKLGSVGKPIPGGALHVDAQGADQGELIYTGPNVMMGYATGPNELALGDVVRGRLATGDLGYCDSDGFFYVVGRMKRFSKLFGVRLNLDEIEAMLRVNGPTAVVGGDERLLICCEYGTEDEFARYAQMLADKLRVHHSAFRFHRVERLPLTANGKPNYMELRANL